MVQEFSPGGEHPCAPSGDDRGTVVGIESLVCGYCVIDKVWRSNAILDAIARRYQWLPKSCPDDCRRLPGAFTASRGRRELVLFEREGPGPFLVGHWLILILAEYPSFTSQTP